MHACIRNSTDLPNVWIVYPVRCSRYSGEFQRWVVLDGLSCPELELQGCKQLEQKEREIQQKCASSFSVASYSAVVVHNRIRLRSLQLFGESIFVPFQLLWSFTVLSCKNLALDAPLLYYNNDIVS